MWKKAGKYTTLNEFVEETQKASFYEFTNDNKNYSIYQMHLVAEKLKEAAITKKLVTIVGDYDSDGLNALLEISFLCIALGIKFNIIVPKRFSEGYGVSEGIIERIEPNGILITIDNGIASLDAIKKAKEKNMYVIVMDHHIASVDENGLVVLPMADIIIDPEAFPESADFIHYCGAGLAFKLATLLLPKEHPFYSKIACFAAIGTIGDVVSLNGDNRKIVKEGMLYLAANMQTTGLKALMDLSKISEDSTSTDYAYKLVPCVNAPGRLEDDGGKTVLKTLFCEDQEESFKYAQEIIKLNDYRKELVNAFIDKIDDSIITSDSHYICYYADDIPEGIIGILAGRLAQASQKCTFVFTKTENGILKCSARSQSEKVHIKKILDRNKSLLLKYGGHKHAAGFSILEKDLNRFNEAMELEFKDIEVDQNVYYDLEITEDEIVETKLRVALLEPFGEGNRKPVFRIKAKMGNKFGRDFQIMGTEKNHIKFCFKEFDAVAFKMADKFTENKFETIDMIGTIEKNIWNGVESIQFMVIDFKKSE